MKMPLPSPRAARLLADLCWDDPRLEVRKLFGQPAVFVRGNLCFGTFGSDFFVRLGGGDREEALALPGSRRFEPMAGHPMMAYIVLPPAVVNDLTKLRRWTERAAAFASSLPPKASKKER